jgi:hypothetical protein
MTRIVLDAAFLGKLHNLSQPLELCDETGKVRAQVVPVLDPADYEPMEPPPLSEEELQKRRSSNTGLTTRELLTQLEKL